MDSWLLVDMAYYKDIHVFSYSYVEIDLSINKSSIVNIFDNTLIWHMFRIVLCGDLHCYYKGGYRVATILRNYVIYFHISFTCLCMYILLNVLSLLQIVYLLTTSQWYITSVFGIISNIFVRIHEFGFSKRIYGIFNQDKLLHDLCK